MPKEVNVHLKTTGAEQTKEQLEQAADATKHVGDKTADAGQKAQTAGGAFSSFFARFAGPLGVIAAITAIAHLTRKVADFFDTIKQRSDEAVRNLQQVRAGFDDIFEALAAFDEKSRQAAVKQTYALLQKTAVPEQIGLPIVNAYIRQFKGLVDKGQLAQEEYQKGLETMLSYGVRHGGPATADLIQLMGGWRMTQAEQQGAFTRQIAAASQTVGLSDQEMIAALSRGMPTIKAMAWTPTQAIEAVATMAAGEPSARMRVGMPAAGLQAIMAPQAEKLPSSEIEAAQRAKSAADKAKAEAARTKTPAAKRLADQAQAEAEAKQLAADQAISDAQKLAEDPLAFLRTIEQRRAVMTRERFNRLLRDIYGPEGGLAVGKLLAERRRDLAETLDRAASPQGAAADELQKEQFKTTLEARDAVTKARAKQIQLDVSEPENIMEDIREIGRERYKLLGRREPIPTRIREAFIGEFEAAQEEYGAFREWQESLTPQEQMQELSGLPPMIFQGGAGAFAGGYRPPILADKWRSMTARQKWEALTRLPAPQSPPAPAGGLEVSPPMPPARTLATEAPPQAMNFDNRIFNYQIFNPVTGINKQDLGIEPPHLA